MITIKYLLFLACIAVLLFVGVKMYGRNKSDPSNVDANEADNLLKANKKIVVLDVRTPEEFQAGHIAGAVNLNFYEDDFEQKLAALDKETPYLVHCAVGGRSAKVRTSMRAKQFKAIHHLEGGMKAWEKAGKPVQR